MNERTYQPWLDALYSVARHYRMDGSQERLRVEADWQQRHRDLDGIVEWCAYQLGLAAVFERFTPALLDPLRLPLVVDLGEGQVGVLEQIDADGSASVRLSGDGGLPTVLDRQTLAQRVCRVLLVKPRISVPDARVDEYIAPYRPDWLFSIVLREWPRYGDVMLASLVANVLALSAMLFTMQVYDRVIPAQSEPTLWVLFSGLVLALSFAFVMRVMRTHIADLVGKRADLRVSDRVFGHALRIRNDARPRSTGTFIAQLRELEQIRELVTSTTIGAISDLPFFVLFLGVIWLVGGGTLALVPLVALPLLIVPGLLAQKPLARLAREGMRESSIRNAMLVESVQAMDDIKLLRAEPRFQNQWNHLNQTTAGIGMRQRFITGLLTSWTQEVQMLVYACVVLVGAYAAMAGELSVGVLVACSMLASRMVAPLGQLTGIMLRWQQAKVAREGLDQLMEHPVDQPDRSVRVHRPVLHGNYALSDLQFRYSKEDARPVLDIADLKITAGERVAILGRNGAGKSSLLQLLAGLYQPQTGQVSIDGLKTSVIDPMDLRRDVALLGQNATLFYGSIRENLTLGAIDADDDDLLRALALAGASRLVESLENGLDHPIMEGGRGLSGGQRQSLLLARTLLRDPDVLLLDEPTAWLDEVAEKQLISQLEGWLGSRTLVVATHRPAVLAWAQRVVVLDQGRVVADGPKDKILVGSARHASSVRKQGAAS